MAFESVGVIKYDFRSKTFVAECLCPDHHEPKCHLTRQASGSALASRSWQGRPLGLLLAWLHDSPDGLTRHEHVHTFPAVVPLDQRHMRRVELEAMDSDLARALLQHERPRREGEPAEPESSK